MIALSIRACSLAMFSKSNSSKNKLIHFSQLMFLRSSPCSLEKAIIEPLKVTRPITMHNASKIFFLGASNGQLTIRAEARPPIPFNRATICGKVDNFTFKANKTPTPQPAAKASSINRALYFKLSVKQVRSASPTDTKAM